MLSRSRVLILNPLGEAEISDDLASCAGGSGARASRVSGQNVRRGPALLAHSAGGDARVALTALDAATRATEPEADGARRVDRETLVEALGRSRFAYDKGGEDHYNLASALIKSLRNSDVDAGLYWLARLIEGGADPVFIARRLCILASEDVGLADPQAMVQAAAAAEIMQTDRPARGALSALAGDDLSGPRPQVERRQARLSARRPPTPPQPPASRSRSTCATQSRH